MTKFSGHLIPQTGFTIEMPDVLDKNSSARVIAMLNRVAKGAARHTMEEHHERHIPLHFKRGAGIKYQHKQRSLSWRKERLRKFHSQTDHVASRRSMRTIAKTSPRISVGGRLTGQGDDKLNGLMRMKRPPKYRDSRATDKGVTSKIQNEEIARVRQDETQKLADIFRAKYMELLTKELARRPKIRKVIGPKVGL